MASKQIGKGWAWRIEHGMCHWAEPRREGLDNKRKPSPEAVKVHVAIVPMKTWRAMLARIRRIQARPPKPGGR